MRVRAMILVAAVLMNGCHGTYVYAARMTPESDRVCIQNCKSEQAIRQDEEEYLVCLSRCDGVRVSERGEQCSDRPDLPGACFDKQVSYVSAMRTVLLIGGIVLGAAAVLTWNASYSASKR